MSDTPPEFIAEDTYQITGHGTVHTGRCPFDWTDRRATAPWPGTRVMFEGRVRRIRGVECFALVRGPRLGDPIGLIFEEDRE